MFESNRNKNLIRTAFDKPLVKRQFDHAGRALVYFGLPSGRLYDVIDWKNYLGRIIAVERDVNEKRTMVRTAFFEGLLGKLQILESDLDELLVSGHDVYKETPRPDTFDLINLDYYGGLLLMNAPKNPKRVAAIRSMMMKQAKSRRDFRVFLTVNVRNRDRGELDRTISNIEEQMGRYGVNCRSTCSWYLTHGVAHKLKLYVPTLLDNIAVPFGLSLTSYDIIMYDGGNSHMVHFALKFSFSTGLQGKHLDLLQLLSAPMYTVRRNRIVQLADYPPQPEGKTKVTAIVTG